MSEFDRLAAELQARIDSLLEATLGEAQKDAPEWMSANVFLWEEITEFARASFGAELDAFRRGRLPSRCPEVDVAGAEAAARMGELRRLLSGYRLGQMVLWGTWQELVEAAVTEPARRRELLDRGSDFFFAYAGLIADFVADVYQGAMEQALRSGEQRRFQAIRGVLEGGSLLDADLGVELEQYHLGFVVWGEDGEAAARRLAATLERPILIVAVLNQSWWGWLSGAHQLGAAGERELKGFDAGPGTGIALGLEAYGEAGFCSTHRQALRARWVARKTERPVVFYADVAVEALASDNQADARAFVAHELAGIDDESATSQQIRETLSAYFAAQHNAASAASALGVHQQTVANRLRRAEERLGHPVGARRVELEVALRLRASLSGVGS